MKENKFVIVTGACMFLLLMMILFNFGGGSKVTYSSTTYSCLSDGFIVVATNKCCPSSKPNYIDGYCCESKYNAVSYFEVTNFNKGYYCNDGTNRSSWTATSAEAAVGSGQDDNTSGDNTSGDNTTPDRGEKCENGIHDAKIGCKSCNAGFHLEKTTDAYGTVNTCAPCEGNTYSTSGNTATSCQTCPEGQEPNASKTGCVNKGSTSETTTVTPKLSVSVDAENEIHVSVTSLYGCGGTLKVTGSGVSIGGTTSKTVDNTTQVTSLVTGAYTKTTGSTKGTITATYTVTSEASGYKCTTPVSKTITVYDDTPKDEDAVTETVCTNGGGTWSNNACSCPTGKHWSNASNKCVCDVGSKEIDGVCKLSAGISVSANKDVLVNTTHPVIVSATNSGVCGGKVTVSSSLGNPGGSFNVTGSSHTFDFKPTIKGSETLTFEYSGYDSNKCYLSSNAKITFTLNIIDDKKAMCEQYYGTWNSVTNKCICNNGYYWRDDINKCYAYKVEDDPTRIGPYLQLNWTEKNIKRGSNESLTICAKSSSETGASGVAGRYYMSGTNHSGGTMTQMEVPAGGCTSVQMYGVSVGTDEAVKIEFSPSDSNKYKPVSTTVKICVYEKNESECKGGSGGGDGTTPDPTPTPSGSTNGNDNTTTNPQTGNIMLFVVWIIGFAVLGYSFWYFKNLNRNGA